MIDIRETGAEDIDTLMLWRERVLREVFSIPDGNDIRELLDENRRYYLEEIPAGGHIACIAYSDGIAVGCGGICLYREMPSPDNPSGRCAYLMNIYTDPSHRGRGIGGAVVSWLKARAAREGAEKVYLETTVDGMGLYRSEGFVEMGWMMRLPISETVRKRMRE